MIWAAWGVVVLFAVSLYIYRSSLQKNEEDQIFLDDSFDHQRTEQAAIVAKVHKVEPVLRVALWLVGIASLCVIGYYVLDVINQFK
jgi:hypothetical protein